MSALSPLEFRPAIDFDYETIADLFTRGFADYFVPVHLNAHIVESIFRTESVDLTQSIVAFRDGDPVGLMTVARRGLNARIQSLGVVKEARRTGVARTLVERAIYDSKDRNDKSLELEVIQANEAAIALYESANFRITGGLVGFKGTGIEGARVDDKIVEISATEMASRMIAAGATDLPWQISPFTIANFTPPTIAVTLQDRAFAIITHPIGERITIRGLWVAPDDRRQGWGTRLIASLSDLHPDVTWNIAPIVPEGLLDPFAESLGWEPLPIRQFKMQWQP